jgi:Zn-dependent protease
VADLGIAAAEYGVFLFSTVCHEASHAWMAGQLGDDTAAQGGQVSLNPVPHIRREPVGMVLVPLIGLATGGYVMGWASTPFNRAWAQEHPRRAAAMALAGPLANLALVLASVVLMRVGLDTGMLRTADAAGLYHVVLPAPGQPDWVGPAAVLLSLCFSLNLVLFFFNLLPVGPLDGAAALGLVPGLDRVGAWLRSARFRLIGLVLAWTLFPHLYGPVYVGCLNLVFPGAGYH